MLIKNTAAIIKECLPFISVENVTSNYAPNFEKVGDILVSACPYVHVCMCMGHGDIVLKLHVWIPHGKIADAYFWFSLNYLPLLNYGPLTNKGMKHYVKVFVLIKFSLTTSFFYRTCL